MYATLVTYILIVVTMENMVMMQGTSRLCEEHCRDPANRDYPYAIRGCNCSHQVQSITESMRIENLTPDQNEISDDEPTGKEASKLDSLQIYYVLNPNKVNIKITNKQPLQRSISEINVRAKKHDHHDSIENPEKKMEFGQRDRPLYLDIGMQPHSKLENIKDFELTEDSLSDCLDLNILIYCRKNKTSNANKKVFNRDIIKKYQNLSDSDLILAIKTKCLQPIDIVNNSLNDVRDRRPKKKNRIKSLLPSTASQINAPLGRRDKANLLTPIYIYATPRHTNEEERDATENPEVSNLALHIDKPIIDYYPEQSNEYRNTEEPAINNKLDYVSSYKYSYSAESRYDIDNIESNVETSTKTINKNVRNSRPSPMPPSNYNEEISPDGKVNYTVNFNTAIPLWKTGENEDISDETPRKDLSNENRETEEPGTNTQFDYESSYQFSNTETKDINDPAPQDKSNENRNAEEVEINTKSDYESSNQYPNGEIVIFEEDKHIGSRPDSTQVHNVVEITEHDINTSPTECFLYADYEQNRNNGKEDGIAQTNEDVAIRNENVTESHLDREYLGLNKETSPKIINIIETNYRDRKIHKNILPSVNVNQTKTEDAAGGALLNISMKTNKESDLRESHASITTWRNLEFVDLTTDEPSTTANSSTTNKPANFLSPNSDNFTDLVLNSAISLNTTNALNGSGTFQDKTKSVYDSVTSSAEKDKPSIKPPTDTSNTFLRNSTLYDDSTNSTKLTDAFANNLNISKVQSEENSVEQYHEYSDSVTHTHENNSDITKTMKHVDSTTESERHTLDVTEEFLSQSYFKESSQILISNTETTPRPQYSEQEIKIPKIITAELENGTVDSHIDGYEVPLKYDFVPDENIDSTEVNLNTTELEPKSEIIGRIYFVFNKFAAPAKFIQDPRGEIRLGLDGFSLCQHWLTDHHQSEFFVKLCKSQKQQPQNVNLD